MASKKLWLYVLSLVLVLLAACSLPTPEASNRVDPVEATRTMIALATQVEATQQAIRAQLPESQPQPDAQGPATLTPLPAEPAFPTDPSPTATLLPPMTSVAPIAHVNENTNCRAGPGTVYDLRYIAMAGDVLPVLANSTFSDYVVVEDPAHPGQQCWLWTRYVDLRGDLTGLPVRTPPPTPTPSLSFSIAYDYVDGCVGWDPAFQVTNTGSVTFKSYYIQAYDTVTSNTISTSVDNFDETNGCPVITSIPELGPGMTGWVHAYSFAYNPTGHLLQVTVSLCTEQGLGGTCVGQSINVTP